MGPRPVGRGNAEELDTLDREQLLQWGRDQLVAEITSSFRSWVRQARLQWGRDQLVAEITRTKVFYPWRV